MCQAFFHSDYYKCKDLNNFGTKHVERRFTYLGGKRKAIELTFIIYLRAGNDLVKLLFQFGAKIEVAYDLVKRTNFSG